MLSLLKMEYARQQLGEDWIQIMLTDSISPSVRNTLTGQRLMKIQKEVMQELN